MKLIVVFLSTLSFLFCIHVSSTSACSLGKLRKSGDEEETLNVCVEVNKQYSFQPLCKQETKHVVKCQYGQCGMFPFQEISEGSNLGVKSCCFLKVCFIYRLINPQCL